MGGMLTLASPGWSPLETDVMYPFQLGHGLEKNRAVCQNKSRDTSLEWIGDWFSWISTMKDIWDNAVTSELKYGVIVTCLFLTISDDLSTFLRFTGLRQRRVAPVVDLTIPIPYNEPRWTRSSWTRFWSKLSTDHKLNAPIATSFRIFFESSFTRRECLNQVISG